MFTEEEKNHEEIQEFAEGTIGEEEVLEEPQEEQTEETTQESGKLGKGLKEELKLFVPNKQFMVTQILVLINVLVYIWMVVSGVDPADPSVESLIDWGGNLDMLFSEGEYWRLLTSCFIHIGFIHLLMNMYALLYVGSYLERLIGHRRFLFAYFITGLISSLASTWWNTNLVSAGASGAIFGMFGVFLILLLSHKIMQGDARKEMLVSIVVFVGYNLLYGLKGEVDNAGHIGGLLSGLAVGLIYMFTVVKQATRKTLLMDFGIPVILFVLMFAFTYSAKGNAVSDYSSDMKFYSDVIDISLRAEDEFKTDDDASFQIKKKETEAFNVRMDSCLALLDQYIQEKGEEEVDPVFTVLREYFAARVKFVNLYLEYEKSGFSGEYEFELQSLQKKIDGLLNYLNAE